MGYRFTIDPGRKMVSTTVTDALLDSDPGEYLAEVLAHPDYGPGYSALVVCRDVKLGAFTVSGVRRLVDSTRRAERDLGATRVAIVASQPVVYGMARMYQMLREAPYELRVFRDLAGAEAWLGCEHRDHAPDAPQRPG